MPKSYSEQERNYIRQRLKKEAAKCLARYGVCRMIPLYSVWTSLQAVSCVYFMYGLFFVLFHIKKRMNAFVAWLIF